jgi:hypothetical protein
MLKRGALLALLLAACTSAPVDPNAPSGQSAGILPSPEADIAAPGMIPLECESLLQKSEEWGYIPGQAWKPANPEQALAVAKFFGNFRLVSQGGSDFFHAIQSITIPAGGETEAAAKLAQVQVCDSNLAAIYLDALTAYRWPAAMKPEAAGYLHQFVLNQQAVVLPLASRFVVLRVYQNAASRGLLRGGQSEAAKNLQGSVLKQMGKIKPAEPVSPADVVARTQKELLLSEEIRAKLSRLLPLP